MVSVGPELAGGGGFVPGVGVAPGVYPDEAGAASRLERERLGCLAVLLAGAQAWKAENP